MRSYAVLDVIEHETEHLLNDNDAAADNDNDNHNELSNASLLVLRSNGAARSGVKRSPPTLRQLCHRWAVENLAIWTSQMDERQVLGGVSHWLSGWSDVAHAERQHIMARLISRRALSPSALALLIDPFTRHLELDNAGDLSDRYLSMVRTA